MGLFFFQSGRMKLERPCCTVALVFQYKTVNGEKRTDKGGKAALFKSEDRLFLLTVKQIALYSDLGNNDTLTNVSIPLLKATRGASSLAYRNVIKDVDIPEWTEVDVSEENPIIPVGEEGKTINLKAHDSVYFLEVTNQPWAKSPYYTPVTTNTINVSLGDTLNFCSQRKLGTGFLAEYPQYRGIREIEGTKTSYPGDENNWYQFDSPYQVPPTNTKDCKTAQISFAFPSSVLADCCYYPPMFLVDINIKSSWCGTPLVNEENELVGLVSDPTYFIAGSKDLCCPGTWVCAVPADINFPEVESTTEATETTEETASQPKKQKPKKKPAKKKKGKGKKK